jgi:hypothetical protein
MGAWRAGTVVAAIAVTVGLAHPGSVLAQFFSPGRLARPHSNLEGLEKCNQCHQEQKGLSAKLCLDCHTELARRVSKGVGFHGRLQPVEREACQNCHPDHRGLDFSMVEWEKGRGGFDHQRTGWLLKGGHAKAHCDDCHQRPLIVDASVRRMLDKFPQTTTYLGLSERCESCHFDEHRSQLGRDCAKCHDEKAWKPQIGFDHQKTEYPLLGKHEDVPCAKCHPNLTDEKFVATAFPRPRAPTFMALKPIEHKSCESCHNDPHKGALGSACTSCHSEVGWTIIKTDRGKDTAFHDKTRYPLRGGHVGVPCQSCHGPFPGQPAKFKGLPFGACTDCHEDAHIGQLKPIAPAKVVACDTCHTVGGFTPVRYEFEQHAKTQFPLAGAHGVAACRGCHPIDDHLAALVPAEVRRRLAQHRRPERFSFAVLHPKESPQACSDCHKDVHQGQFLEDKNDQNNQNNQNNHDKNINDCAACHQTTSFVDLKFDHDKQSRFPLVGKHKEAACAGCHKTEKPLKGPAFVRYKPVGTSCGGCHTDAHQGQFLTAASRPSDGLPGDASEATSPIAARDCDFCHETTGFKKTIFDHNNRRFTTFALEGKHAKVKCAGCHAEVRVTQTITTVRYRPIPRACEGCHVDYHHGAFRGFEP